MGKLLGLARKSRSRAAMEEITSAAITVDEGLEGDYRGRLRRRQISVLAREDWDRVCTELGRDLSWTTRRANLYLEGIALKDTQGARLKIGEDVILEVHCETDPCSRMDELSEGLRKALESDWRGGVCCRVISGGRIAAGDSVVFENVQLVSSAD